MRLVGLVEIDSEIILYWAAVLYETFISQSTG